MKWYIADGNGKRWSCGDTRFDDPYWGIMLIRDYFMSNYSCKDFKIIFENGTEIPLADYKEGMEGTT